MKIALNTPARKRLVAIVGFALAITYFIPVMLQFLASWYGSQAERAILERAARLDPGDAEHRYHLGRYRTLVDRDPAAAIAPYREAVRLNPHSARYWFDLASAYQV